jgi:chromosome segregation ATPase
VVEECETELKQMKKIPQETIANIVENKKKLDVARAECSEMKASLEHKNAAVMKLKRKWMTGVRDLVSNVNDKFRGVVFHLSFSLSLTLIDL